MTKKIKQPRFYENHERLASYTNLIELNRTLWKRFKLKLDIALGDWVDVNGIEIRFFEHCIWKLNEKTGHEDLWSMKTLDKAIDDMRLHASLNAESEGEAEELIEIIGDFLGEISCIFDVTFARKQ